MNVYLLIEELEQKEFSDSNGWDAAPITTVVGVFSDREKAEKEKITWEQNAIEDEEKNNCDPCTYYIEERPVL